MAFAHQAPLVFSPSPSPHHSSSSSPLLWASAAARGARAGTGSSLHLRLHLRLRLRLRRSKFSLLLNQTYSFSSSSPLSVRAEIQGQGEPVVGIDSFTQFKHVLLPITDQNPFLSEGTKQAVATITTLAKQSGADITVVVIDENEKESIPEHEKKLSSIRWHLSEGGFQEFKLMERFGESKKPTAIIGEVADDLNFDLVVLSMEAIHSKHVDANLLAEFIPCPVLLLPL